MDYLESDLLSRFHKYSVVKVVLLHSKIILKAMLIVILH